MKARRTAKPPSNGPQESSTGRLQALQAGAVGTAAHPVNEKSPPPAQFGGSGLAADAAPFAGWPAPTEAICDPKQHRPARRRPGCADDQCDEAVDAPTPVWARTYWSSKASFSATAALLLSRVENSQVVKNAIGIENSAGWV